MKQIQMIIGVLLICLVLLMGSLLAKNSAMHNNEEYQERLEAMSMLRYTSISDRLHDYETIAIAVKQFFMSSEFVTREEFDRFVEPILERSVEIQAIEWIPEVSSDQRSMYVQNAIDDGLKDFEIMSLVEGKMVISDEKETYYPVYYVYPLKGNEAALGLDLGSNQSRITSLMNATAWNDMVISEPIRLVQDEEEGLGFLMIYAIQDESKRERNGYILIVYKFNDFVQRSLMVHEDVGLDVMVMDTTAGDYQLVYQSKEDLKIPTNQDNKYFRTFPMRIGGREWSIIFIPSTQNVEMYLPKTENTIWMGIVLLVSVIGFYLFYSFKNEQRLEKRIDAQVKEIDNQKMQLQIALQGAGQALWDWNLETDKTIMGQNWINLIGYSSDELNAMKDPWKIIIHPIDYQRIQDILMRTIEGKDDFYHAEYRMVKKDGSVGWFYDEGRTFEHTSEGRPTRFAGTVHDVTEIVKLREQLKERAVTDQLTGLYNRRYLFEQLEKFFALHKRHDQQFCLVIMDIDYFKKVNDTYGHQTGDYVLNAFARFIKERLRGTDLVARYGGEEFVAVLNEVSLIEARALIDEIRIAVDLRTLNFEGNEIHHTFSAGVVSFSEVTSIDEVVSLADERLYAAKETGRNKVISD